jgi:hypothetical protein
LRTNRSKRIKIGVWILGQQQLFNFGNESVGGHDVGETQVPNRVEDSSSEEGHVLYKQE